MTNEMWHDGICDECAGNCAWCHDKDECKCSCNTQPEKNGRCGECVECLKETVTELDEIISGMRVELRKNIQRIESLLNELDSIYNLADDGGN